MIRRAAVVVLALALNPALVRAQDAALTVTADSADVYKGPTTATPIIGHVPRGTVLPVARNLGSWVRIDWPDAPDGVGYVHVTMGRLTGGSDASAATSAARPTSASRATASQPVRRTTVGPIARRSSAPVTSASHILGVGGLVAPTNSFGATARAWRDNHFAIQVGLTRDAMASEVAPGRVTSLQVDPGVVYGLFDRVTDYVWFRPYVGSSVSLRRETFTAATPVIADPVSDTGFGFRVFGGAEMMFASAPRFGLSADVGYRHVPTPFAGFDASPVTLSISGHWYIR